MLRALLTATLLLLPAAYSQSFEVASVKPAPNCRMTGAGGPTPGRLELPCVTLRAMIRMAYGAFQGETLNARLMDVTGGPSWLNSDSYQVSAKAEGNASGPQMMGPMLRKLLEERFQLKVHTEAKETPVYSLTVVKPGKLTPAKEGSCVPIELNNIPRPTPGTPMPNYCGGGSMSGSASGMVANIPGSTMDEFAGRMLAGLVGRPVIDKTGLTGRFDLHLEFARPLQPGATLNGAPAPDLPPPSDGAPSIFTALQEQLGLKLSPDKAQIPSIVVDSAVKPLEN